MKEVKDIFVRLANERMKMITDQKEWNDMQKKTTKLRLVDFKREMATYLFIEMLENSFLKHISRIQAQDEVVKRQGSKKTALPGCY